MVDRDCSCSQDPSLRAEAIVVEGVPVGLNGVSIAVGHKCPFNGMRYES